MLEQQNTTAPQDGEGEDNLLVPSADDAIKELLGGSYDKFKGDDGKLDTAKLAKSYRGLETKLGSGDLPPDSPDGYGMPEQLPEGVTADQLGLKELYADLHKAGATKKVVELITGKYLEMVGKGIEVQKGQAGAADSNAKAALAEAWGEKYNENISLAQKAFKQLADPEDIENIKQLGSNVAVMKFLAKIGKNMREDSPVQSHGNPMSGEDLQSLMKSEAYWNNKHPDHAKVKKTVTDHFMAKNMA